MLLLLCESFVDVHGFLAVMSCGIGVAGFFGEDFEDAEVDGLLGRAVSKEFQ